MTKVITFSRTYPSYHIRKGEPTNFVEKIYKSIGFNPFDSYSEYDQLFEYDFNKDKHVMIDKLFHDLDEVQVFNPKGHTIRAGHRWKAGDWFKPVVWSDKPYRSKQIQFAPDIQIIKTWDIHFKGENPFPFINNKMLKFTQLAQLAANDGLEIIEFTDWFKKPDFDGQIISWSNKINY